MQPFIGRGSFSILVKTISVFSIVFALSGCATLNNAFEAVGNRFNSLSDRYMQEGDRLAGEQRQPEALLAYRQAVEADPNNLPAIKKLAMAYQAEGRRRLALGYLQDAQKLKPDDPDLPGFIAKAQASPQANTPVKLLWSTQVVRGVPVGYCLWQGKLFVAYEQGQVAALDAATGKTIWQASLSTQASSPPAVSNGLIFIGGQDGKLYTINASNGKIMWSFPTKAPIYAAAAATDGQVFLSSSDGSLYALSLPDGKLLWSYQTAGALRASPAVSGGVVYFGSADAHLYAIDMTSGVPRWQKGILTQGAVESQPIVNANRVVFGSSDGSVYSLAVELGTVLALPRPR